MRQKLMQKCIWSLGRGNSIEARSYFAFGPQSYLVRRIRGLASLC